MRHGSLFSGIGGFDLAADWMGWENVFQVEIDPFCRRILKKNFPDAQRFADIKKFDGSQFRGAIDIVSGGFPCQPFSIAGNRRGNTDDRALWREVLRVVRTICPTWVVGENVPGIISMELDAVLADLEAIGYTCQSFTIPACAVGAIHRRERVWIIAHAKSAVGEFARGARHGRSGHTDNTGNVGRVTPHANSQRREQFNMPTEPTGSKLANGDVNADATNTKGQRWQEWGHGSQSSARQAVQSGHALGRHHQQVEWQPDSASEIIRTAYGLPGRVDRRAARIKALGNAIVPQVAYQIFQAIQSTHNQLIEAK